MPRGHLTMYSNAACGSNGAIVHSCLHSGHSTSEIQLPVRVCNNFGGRGTGPHKFTLSAWQVRHIFSTERSKSPGCRQETLLSGNARSATRVHFLCYPALVYSICHVARVAYCFSCPHSGHRNAVIAIIRLSSSLRPPGNFSSFAEPGCQWVCVVKTN